MFGMEVMPSVVTRVAKVYHQLDSHFVVTRHYNNLVNFNMKVLQAL